MKRDSLNAPIGLLGGTFDPIHVGHLRMAIEIAQACQLEKVHLIPCYKPVHRQNPFASATQRFEMVMQAVQDNHGLIADDCEIKRQQPSYTIDTLADLRQRLPNTPLCVLIGIDAFLEFHTWHRYDEILQTAHLIIADRYPYQMVAHDEVNKMLSKHQITDKKVLHQQLAGGILIQPIPQLEISSTFIRKQIELHMNTRYLLPDNVYTFIKEQNIYSKPQ